MQVLYNYQPYKTPMRAMYIRTGERYIKDPITGDMGWEQIEMETVVIGEDETTFIDKLMPHTICDSNDPDYGKTVLLPLGFHKSRLVKWLGYPVKQMKLFDVPPIHTETCLNCKHRERHKCGGKVIQYCGVRKSNRTHNGFLKIKCKQVACVQFEKWR